jgi:hypothetical protein
LTYAIDEDIFPPEMKNKAQKMNLKQSTLLSLITAATCLIAPAYGYYNHNSHHHTNLHYHSSPNPNAGHHHRMIVQLQTNSNKLNCEVTKLNEIGTLIDNHPTNISATKSTVELDQNMFYGGSSFWSGIGINVTYKLECHYDLNDDAEQDLGFITIESTRDVGYFSTPRPEGKVIDCSTPCLIKARAVSTQSGAWFWADQKAQISWLISKKYKAKSAHRKKIIAPQTTTQ